MVVRPALLYSLGVGQSRRLKSKDDCRGEKMRMICWKCSYARLLG